MPLQQGTKVMLLGLQSSPEFNFKVGELGAYLHDSQRWVVELPCGRKVKVRQANMQTIEASVNNFYTVFGYPDENTPALADLVEIRTGEHGRCLVAKQPISKSTYARDDKLRVSMTAAESKHLGKMLDGLIAISMSELLQKEVMVTIQNEFNVTASYVEKCVQQGWLENDFVRDLMNYDYYSPEVLQESFERMYVEDIFWHCYWCSTIPDVPADTLWRLQMVLSSHGFVRDRSLTLGRSSYANTPPERWTWYKAKRRGKKPKPLTDAASATGNFMEMPSWLLQEQQDGQIPLDTCVIFHADISAGEELLMDYEEDYFLACDKQLRHVCPPDVLPYLFNIVRPLDPRVAQALAAHIFLK